MKAGPFAIEPQLHQLRMEREPADGGIRLWSAPSFGWKQPATSTPYILPQELGHLRAEVDFAVSCHGLQVLNSLAPSRGDCKRNVGRGQRIAPRGAQETGA